MPSTNIKITATDKSKAAFTSANKSVSALKGGIVSMKGALVGFLSIAGAKMLTSWTSDVMDAADEIGKMSARLDISTAALQKFRYAGQLSGESISSMDNNLVKFVRNVGDAHNGVTTIADEFERLGIDLKKRNGEWKSHEEVLNEVADAYKDTLSPTRKLSSAMTLFGRGGRVMVNMLSEGSEGLKRHGLILNRVSGIIRDDFVEASEEANDQLTLWGKIWDSSTSRVMSGMVEGFLDISEALLKVKGLDPVKIMGIKRLSKEYNELDTTILKLTKSLQEGEKWYHKIGLGSLEAIKKERTAADLRQNTILAQIKQLKKLSEKKEEAKNVTVKHAKEEKKAFLVTTEMQKLHTSLLDQGIAKHKKAQDVIRSDKIKALKLELEGIRKSKEASQFLVEMRLSMGDVEMQQIQELYDKRKIAISDAYGDEIRWAELAKDKKVAAEKDYNDAVFLLHSERASSIADTAKNTADLLHRQGLIGFDAMRGMAYVQAMINANLAATKALSSLPPPYSYVAAGLAYAYAAGKAYEISHMEPPGRAMGGSVTAGRSYIVGERGPEMLTMGGSSGYVTPNSAMGGTTNINFNIRANDAAGFDQLLNARRGMIISMINRALHSKGRKGLV